MSTRERILSIRLLDKVSKHPLYAQSLGIDATQEQGMAEFPGRLVDIGSSRTCENRNEKGV